MTNFRDFASHVANLDSEMEVPRVGVVHAPSVPGENDR